MPGGPYRNKGEKMSDKLTVSCSCGEGVYTIETGGVVLPQIVIDNRGVPQEQQAGTAKRLLAGASLYCYCSMLEAALLARDVDFEDIRATAELQLGRNEQGKSRVLKMVIRCSVRVNERDEAVFRRVQKMMAQGCLVTGSLHDGIPMEYELEPTFFEE